MVKIKRQKFVVFKELGRRKRFLVTRAWGLAFQHRSIFTASNKSNRLPTTS